MTLLAEMQFADASGETQTQTGEFSIWPSRHKVGLRINRSATKEGSGAHELANYFVGQVVGQLDRVRPARQVVLDMVTEYVEVAQRFADEVADSQL